MRRNPAEGRRALREQLSLLPKHLPELQTLTQWQRWKKEAEADGTWQWRAGGERLMAPPVHLNVVLSSSEEEESDEEAEKRKADLERRRAEEERKHLVVDDSQCTWRKVDALHTYRCTNLRYEERPFCCYHVEACVGSTHLAKGEAAPEVQTMNQDGLCAACYEQRHADGARPQDRVAPKIRPLDVPGVIRVNEQHAMRGLDAIKAGGGRPETPGEAASGFCDWALKTEDGRRFKCENAVAKHPQTRHPFAQCGYHLEECAMTRDDAFCDPYEDINELGLCLAHYAEHFLDPDRLPPAIDSLTDVPGVIEKRRRGRGGVLLRHRFAVHRGHALGEDFFDMRDAMPGGDGVQLLRPRTSAAERRLEKLRKRRERKNKWKRRRPRNRLLWRVNYLRKRRKAAARIQALARGRRARRRVAELLARARARRRVPAARTLQRYARGMLGRRAYREYHAVMSAAALDVQRVVRGMLARLHLTWGDAAVVIQAQARVWLAVRRVADRRAARELELEQEAADAREVLELLAREVREREVMALGRLARWFAGRKLRKQQRELRKARLARAAATKIQRWWLERCSAFRRVVTRKLTMAAAKEMERRRRGALRPEVVKLHAGIPMQLRVRAVLGLQRLWRGHTARRRVAALRAPLEKRWRWLGATPAQRRQLKGSPAVAASLYHSRKRWHMLPRAEDLLPPSPSWDAVGADPDAYVRAAVGCRGTAEVEVVAVPRALSRQRRSRLEAAGRRSSRDVRWSENVQLWDELPTAGETDLVQERPEEAKLSLRAKAMLKYERAQKSFECGPLTEEQLGRLVYSSPSSSSPMGSEVSQAEVEDDNLPDVIPVRLGAPSPAGSARRLSVSSALSALSAHSTFSDEDVVQRPLPAGIPLAAALPFSPLPSPSPAQSPLPSPSTDDGEEEEDGWEFDTTRTITTATSSRRSSSPSLSSRPPTDKRRGSTPNARAFAAERAAEVLLEDDGRRVREARVADLAARADVLSEPRMPVRHGVVLKVTAPRVEWAQTESFACVFPGCGLRFTHAAAAHLHQREHRGQPRLVVAAPGADARMAPFWPKRDLPTAQWGPVALRQRRPIVGFHICPVRRCRVQFRQRVQLERHVLYAHGDDVAFATGVAGAAMYGRTGAIPPMANAPARTPPIKVCPEHSIPGARLIRRCEQCEAVKDQPVVPCDLFEMLSLPVGALTRVLRLSSLGDPVVPEVRWPAGSGERFFCNVIALVRDKRQMPWLAVSRFHPMRSAVDGGLRPGYRYDTAYEVAEEEEVTYVRHSDVVGVGAVYRCSRRAFYRKFQGRAIDRGLQPFFCRLLFSHKSNVVLREREPQRAVHRF